ncbi:hypothetical protein [Shimia sp.]|jgi:dienelactone hydrolase|uniref:hypothetical protein n=1 Tax=unclassified Shimia TaxID=2630038 RepID=UPI0025D9297D|nr:hypothetical protein [Shimia sp.]MCH2067256.1 hypothetical protein [Shimia sp.]
MSLIVVTDIHGAPDEALCLSAGLPGVDRLSLADLCDQPPLSGEALHHHLFQEDGMARAVRRLCDMMADQPALIGLGYSAGGTALWRAAQAGVPLTGLICVSSTRLRDERALAIPTQVYFGDNDPGRPSEAWLTTVPATATLLPNAAHAFYAEVDHPARAQVAADIAATITRWTAA